MYWLPERVLRALHYEKQMHGIAATPVADPDEMAVCTEDDHDDTVQVPPAAPTATAPHMVGRVFAFPTSDVGVAVGHEIAMDRRVVETYHQDAIKGNHWCRVEDCFHRAPAQGDCCPVHKDLGLLPIYDGPDAA